MFPESNIEEVTIIKEMMDQEDIKTIIASLQNLTANGTKEEKQETYKKIKKLTMGKKLFGFKIEKSKPRMSKELGELQIGSEFKEEGVLQEALESGKRQTMVDALQHMIELSKKSDNKSQTGIFMF